MGASSAALALSSPLKTHYLLPINLSISSSSSSSCYNSHSHHLINFTLKLNPQNPPTSLSKTRNFPPLFRHSLLLSPPSAVAESVQQSSDSSPSSSNTSNQVSSKVDKSGRFSSPRAARELALLIGYAACLEGSDPVRLFDKRVNSMRYPGHVFNRESLSKYNHMSFGGAPVAMETEEEAEQLLLNNENESLIEEEVLLAPPKLVYNKFVLRLTRDMLEAMVNKWDKNVLVIDKITPPNWKNEPAGRILEFCLLHLAMSEITVLGTRHQIVINEAIDLAKRFCDGTAPRIINGCLRTFVKQYNERAVTEPSESRT